MIIGGSGDDTYFVNDIGDQVIENDAAGGIDTIITSISYALSDFVEHLTASGPASISLTGNGLDNLLFGNTGRNTLKGGAGNDTLRGDAGKDVFAFKDKLSKRGNLDKIADFNVKDDSMRRSRSPSSRRTLS